MPNRDVHVKQGGAAGTFVACLANILEQAEKKRRNPYYQFDFLELGGMAALGYGAGYLGGLLPDMLEPACHPKHRDFCHSVLAAGLLVAGAKKLNDNPNVGGPVKAVMNTLTAGYCAHLVADGQTPAGIPLVTRR